MQNENELNPFILNTLKNRSMLTRAITVSLIILLIISASTISILIATGNDSQKASIERLLGFKKELLNPGDIVYLNTPKEKNNIGVYLGNTESIQPSENKIKNIKTNEIKNYDSKLSDSLEIQNSTINELSKRIDLKNKFINDYASWKGVQYRLGGDGRISKIAESISAVLLNLSVIVFLGFVMRAVLVFIRYYMQLGTDYENQRLAYILSKGDNNKFSDILYTLRENKINFEKTPSPPQEKIILSALELLKQKNKNG